MWEKLLEPEVIAALAAAVAVVITAWFSSGKTKTLEGHRPPPTGAAPIAAVTCGFNEADSARIKAMGDALHALQVDVAVLKDRIGRA